MAVAASVGKAIEADKLAAASAAKNTGGRIIFTESRPSVREILKRLRLHSVLHTIPGYEEALAEARRK